MSKGDFAKYAEQFNKEHAGLVKAWTIAIEQRCERGTPWDLACVTIANKIGEQCGVPPIPTEVYDKVKGHAVTQSTAESDDDRPIGFRTNDVPDPYAEGPQSDAEPPREVYDKVKGHAVTREREVTDEERRRLCKILSEMEPWPCKQAALEIESLIEERVAFVHYSHLARAADEIERLTKERDEARVGAQVNLDAAHAVEMRLDRMTGRRDELERIVVEARKLLGKHFE